MPAPSCFMSARPSRPRRSMKRPTTISNSPRSRSFDLASSKSLHSELLIAWSCRTVVIIAFSDSLFLCLNFPLFKMLALCFRRNVVRFLSSFRLCIILGIRKQECLLCASKIFEAGGAAKLTKASAKHALALFHHVNSSRRNPLRDFVACSQSLRRTLLRYFLYLSICGVLAVYFCLFGGVQRLAASCHSAALQRRRPTIQIPSERAREGRTKTQEIRPVH